MRAGSGPGSGLAGARNITASRRLVPYSGEVNGKTWKAWLVPGGLLLGLAVGIIQSPLFAVVVPSLDFFYFAVFAAGLVLAWRFNSSRMLFCLLTLLLAHRAVDFFSAGKVDSGPGHMTIVLAAVLVPGNFMAFAAMRERGLAIGGIGPRAGVLFLESVIVAVLCRPENSRVRLPHASIGEIPRWLLPVMMAAIAICVWRFVKMRTPIEPGFAWATVAVFMWLEFTPLGKVAEAYVGTAGLILAASLIETSYVLAYYDELTGIRGRRAFNEALPSLDQQYAIAIVDIDHFKKFNDTYGHDVGDQVLCMVASRLSKVAGGGQAFRCGGEEFAIIFSDVSAKDACEHLDALRRMIQDSAFRVRGGERRTETRPGESDRRRLVKNREAANSLAAPVDRLSVTVSIGVADPTTRYRQPEQVIQAADRALYRAKQKGRNRVELASMAPPRVEKAKRKKASVP
jgi:diguanylate cyclase (GGDEF)-like protein